MASFQFSFGDFSLEEGQKYFKELSCVQFPPWILENGDLGDSPKVASASSLQEDPTYQPCSNGPTLMDMEYHSAKDPKLIATDQNDNKAELLLPSNDIVSQNADKNVNGLDHASQSDAGCNEVEENLGAGGIDDSETNKAEIHDTPMVNGHVSDNDDPNDVERAELINGVANGDEIPAAVRETLSDKTTEKDGVNTSTPSDLRAISSPPSIKEKQKTTWASLFTDSAPQLPKQPMPMSSPSIPKPVQAPVGPKDFVQMKKKQHTTIVHNGTVAAKLQTEVVDVEADSFSRQLADQIARNEIVYRSPGLMPRGFINSSNWCYVNATLQALLTSSPFCHLMRSLPSRQTYDDANIVSTSTPILDSFVRLVKELRPLPKKNFQRPNKEQFQGTSHEPEYIYKMLATIKSKFSERGRQEDAEEFLSCVLNGLHEEMLKVLEYYFGKNPQRTQNSDDHGTKNSQMDLGYEVPVHDDEAADDSNEEDDQWEEVSSTRKNRSSVMRRADISKTPVSDVFRGELRSDLFQEGQRGTATLEPFFTLPLDINDQKTWSVAEALEHLTRLETVQDFTNSKTKVKVEATRRLTLETLPPVLILHLKRFVYDKEGGLLKIGKEVQYHTDLVIGKELLSKSSKKISQEKRTYKLFAVVYHHGKEATGGHYTSDVYHDGLNCWLRIDDQHIKMTNVHEVVRHSTQRTAYILYYKRTDLMAV